MKKSCFKIRIVPEGFTAAIMRPVFPHLCLFPSSKQQLSSTWEAFSAVNEEISIVSFGKVSDCHSANFSHQYFQLQNLENAAVETEKAPCKRGATGS